MTVRDKKKKKLTPTALISTIYLVVKKSGDSEHFPSTFTVSGRDDGRMHIEEPAALEKLMRGIRQLVAHAHHCAHLQTVSAFCSG